MSSKRTFLTPVVYCVCGHERFMHKNVGKGSWAHECLDLDESTQADCKCDKYKEEQC